ncbi:MAG: hypothetical protein KZQ65_09860 [Candidatus Thiodiazotropha sp. (ex Gloverina cf. vestifex)]|nr:hypothetical protein [Candidatus Thiodiazotropha sp. (ex Gloverina cf. vestifex)]
MTESNEKKRTPPPQGNSVKDSKRDYSSKPQKPITLKSGVRTPTALKRGAPKTQKKPKRTSVPSSTKNLTKKKTTPNSRSQGVLRGISPKAKKIALAAAKQKNITVNEWLESVILQSTQPEQQADNRAVENSLSVSLKSIDERLERLEQQKGFWARFWDQFMEQTKKKG